MTADDSIKCPCVNSGMTGKWVVFKIDGFVCTRFLPFSPTPPRSFTCAIFYRGLWLFFFIVLWSYGRKIWLNMCHGNSENSYGCSYLLRICFIYGTNVSVSRSPSATWPLTRCLLIYQQTSANQNTVRSLNGVRKRRLTAKETSIANCEVWDEKYRIAVQRILVGIIIKAGGLR